MTLAVLLLAAGRSRRYGAEDKLLVPMGGKPLIRYAAASVLELEAEARIVAISNPALRIHLNSFEIVSVSPDADSQSQSLRAGLAHPAVAKADKLLIVLGDMPFVTPGLMLRVARKAKVDTPAAATNGKKPMPPACFPQNWFGKLASLRGDTGARALLQTLPASALVRASARVLHDIDTPADFTCVPPPEDLS